jgi:hypothetical protein
MAWAPLDTSKTMLIPSATMLSASIAMKIVVASRLKGPLMNMVSAKKSKAVNDNNTMFHPATSLRL